VNEQIVVTHIRPLASDEEVVVITKALAALWPKPTMSRVITLQSSWRFSGRRSSR